MGHPSTKYSAEFKQQAVRLYRERGGIYAETARSPGRRGARHRFVITAPCVEMKAGYLPAVSFPVLSIFSYPHSVRLSCALAYAAYRRPLIYRNLAISDHPS